MFNGNYRPQSDFSNESNFEVSQYLTFDEWIEEEDPAASMLSDGSIRNPVSHEEFGGESGGTSTYNEGPSSRESESSQEKKEVKERFAFKTKSEIEVMDDGFKWRKYGKKMVKNSPNPRNYYRCSVEGCPVKKRVERDNEDPRYVLTTYEGIHNHQSH